VLRIHNILATSFFTLTIQNNSVIFIKRIVVVHACFVQNDTVVESVQILKNKKRDNSPVVCS